MKIALCADDRTLEDKRSRFIIEFDKPDDLSYIDGPDYEGQTTPEEVFVDRKLEMLERILKNGYKCVFEGEEYDKLFR